MKSVRPKGRLAAALALSVALHAGLVAWLAARPPAPRAEQERIELRLVEVEAKEAEPPVATARPAPKPRATARGTATPTPTATSNPTPTAAATAPGGATPLPGSPEWLASHGLEPAEAKGVSLALPWRGGGAVAEGTASTTERVPGEPAEVAAKRNVDGWLRDLIAMEKAVRHPDGYWSEVRQRLEKGFAPGWEILTGTRQQVGLFSRGQLRALAEFWKGYEEQAARYGATGNAYGAEEAAPGNRRTLADDVRNLSILPDDGGVLAAARPESRIFHRELVALIRIRQEPDGKVGSVELLRTSGNTVYDRLALERAEALRAEGEPALGPTPPQGRETLWAFATSFDMVPPVPVVGFSFDAWFVPTDVTYPLKKSARSEVELKAVY